MSSFSGGDRALAIIHKRNGIIPDTLVKADPSKDTVKTDNLQIFLECIERKIKVVWTGELNMISDIEGLNRNGEP